MSLDACFLSFLTRQLNSELCGMRTEKVFMPSKDECVFVLRGGQQGGKRRLLINASTNAPRVSLTDAETENPAVPPTFCMVLRKHFIGGRLCRVYMPQFERCVVFEFECKNDFFEPVVKSIVVELMGRSANMIIIEGDVYGGKIIDAVRRADLSGGRTVLPSARFEPAPAQEGKIPFSQLKSADALLSNSELTLERAIMQNVSGISPLNAREIAYLATGVGERRCGELSMGDISRLEELIAKIQNDINSGECRPTVVRRKDSGALVDFSFMPIRQYGSFCITEQQATPSDAVEEFFAAAAKKMRFEQKTRDLSQLLTRLSSRISRTMAVRQKELRAADKAEQYRIYGELINANLYRLKNGMTEFEAENYYDDCKIIKIPLRAQLSPSANAQAYFKKYNKAKNSAVILERLIEKDRAELSYLESVFLSLCDSESLADAEQIRDELVRGGYLKRTSKIRAVEKPSAPRELRYGGFTILVGRNNIQNDLVTVKLSRRDDIWLHTKSIHSSHVLIRCRGAVPPDDVIEYAARVCAFYSKGKNDTKVEVDYCPVQNVRKPSGAKPGMVVYDGYRTVVVEPLEVK